MTGLAPPAHVASTPDQWPLAGMAHPAFAPVGRWLDTSTFPSLAMLNAWARDAPIVLPNGCELRFVPAPSKRLPAADYECRIAQRGEVATRPNSLHDVFNALVWLAFPRSKAALNAIHVADADIASGKVRSRARDAATLLDEGGVIVACADAQLLELWRSHRWRELFWTRRADIGGGMSAPLALRAFPPGGSEPCLGRPGARLGAPLALRAFPPGGSEPCLGRPGARLGAPLALRAFPPSASEPSLRRPAGTLLRVVTIGHGLLQKLLAPFPSVSARALVLAVDARELPDDPAALASRLDADAAAWLRECGQRFTPAALLPLPVAGLPGWDPERDYLGERRFDDASIFRLPPTG